MAIRHSFHGRLLALGALAMLALAGCGGGGSDTTPTTGLPPTSNVGAVGIVITDAPVMGWDRAMATLTRIDLIGEEGTANVFTGSETIDLLDLGSYSEVFHLASSVPAGSYEKIRVNVSALELQKLDESGSVAESTAVTIPGGGKIDLNPRRTFRVSPDSTLMVQLDFDMEKSLKIMTTGNGRVMMRPVVFVSILDDEGFDRFTRVHGLVDELAADGFRICQTGLTSRRGSDDEDDDDDESRHCLDVALSPDAGLFDANGDPTDGTGIQPGVELTVIGALRRDDHDTLYAEASSHETASSGDDDDSDDDEPGDDHSGDHDEDDDSGDDRHFDDDVVLVGHVVEFGPAGTFRRYRGEATSSVDGLGEFGLALSSGQGFPEGTNITGLVQPGTKIISRQALPLLPQDIDAGVAGLFEGVLQLSDTDPDLLKTSFIVLDLETGSDVLRGTIQQVLAGEDELRVSSGGVERCIAAGGARIFLVESGETFFSSQEITLAELSPGLQVDAYGTEDACFQARYIFAEAADSVGGNLAPTADAGADQTVSVGDSVQLDGTGSSDPDSDPLSFSWTLTAVPTGSGAALSDPSAAQPTFTADVAGTYEAQLVVSDGTVNSAADTVVITATEPSPGAPAPDLPTADAGPDQSVSTGDTVQLDGTSSTDPSGTGLTYSWSFTSIPGGSTASLSDPSSPTPSFVADVAGNYVVQLVVSNADGDSTPDSVTITATSATGGLDGAQLYADNCQMCHGGLTNNDINDKSFQGIKDAIAQIGPMRGISLTDEEIQAISDALNQ